MGGKIMFHALALGYLGFVGFCYSKSQYYRGRIDAIKDVTDRLTEMVKAEFGIDTEELKKEKDLRNKKLTLVKK